MIVISTQINMINVGSRNDIQQQGVISPFYKMLSVRDAQVVQAVLDGILNILKVAFVPWQTTTLVSEVNDVGQLYLQSELSDLILIIDGVELHEDTIMTTIEHILKFVYVVSDTNLNESLKKELIDTFNKISRETIISNIDDGKELCIENLLVKLRPPLVILPYVKESKEENAFQDVLIY